MYTTGVAMMVGDWFAGYTINKLANFVASHVSDHWDVLTDVEEKLKEIQDRLPRIQAVIHEAEGRPIRDPALVNWLRQIKEAAYEADDLLDEIEYRQLEDQVQDKGKVSALAASALRFVKNLFVSDDELKRLKNLLGDVDKIYSEIDRKNVELKEDNAKHTASIRETSSFTQEVVFGRDKERERILEMLLSSGNDANFLNKGAGSSSHASLGVLPIVGIGGVGKTTLAQIIYNDPRVADHFELRKWVYVSNDFNVKRIARDLEGEMASDSRPGHISLDTQLSNLSHATAGKRFLFVLDDVWDEAGKNWKELRSALTYGNRGSTILITTQSPLVAEFMGTMDQIELQLLKESDYWRLFEHCAFGSRVVDSYLRRKLQLIGQQIAKKLHGLPLAGKVLGSLLHTRLEEQYWKMIQESEWWANDFVLENILPSLGLSYQHLSSNVKQCFAFTAMFPKSHIFDKEQLVQMWIAQGFITPETQHGRMTLEDIGNQIFDELTCRYFFLHTINERYVIHDLIRELALYISRDECFVIDDEPSKIPSTARHVTVIKTAKLDTLAELTKLHKVRTLVFYRDYHPEDLFSLGENGSIKFYESLEGILRNLKNLRILDLSYMRIEIKKLPDAICDLSHLRYLDISGTKIRQLPESFSKIYHLQVLKLKLCWIKKLPAGMNRLIKMRHLHADADTISLVDGIGRLTDLQELDEFRITRKRGHQIGELKELRDIRRRLVIQNLECVETQEEALEAKLKDKEHLDHLVLNFKEGTRSQGDIQKDIMEGLEPHYNIKRLTIQHYRGLNSPCWLEKNHLTNLVSISLERCARWEDLPPLGHLPFLMAIYIFKLPVRKIGAKFYGDARQVFPSLQELTFNTLNEWEELSESDSRTIFPCLRIMRIETCPNLRRIPVLPLISMTHFQIWNSGDIGNALPDYLLTLTSLICLELRNCAQRASVSLYNLRFLEYLRLLECPELTLIGGLQSLANLKDIIIEKCPKLIEPAQMPAQAYGEQELRSLSTVWIDDSVLKHVWEILGRIPCIQMLRIQHCNDLSHFNTEQEEWFQQLTALNLLEFQHCQKLQKLPSSLGTASSIKILSILDCPNIESLPDNGLPFLLQKLEMYGCTKLKDRCRKDDGLDWPLISNIPNINIDGELIQMQEQQHQRDWSWFRMDSNREQNSYHEGRPQ
ncbi:disease resistance protein RGA2-like [Zingiber officinale]|uniref:disease resistance protein RGA2-like n=1 Tax=Zingiber officinale TaxID=94328 RepID=UPI001C4D84C3|nr:disease resistance protein RGA2-like [Zingiber officinale]